MEKPTDCCRDLVLRAPTASPFSRFVLMENDRDNWSGAAECGQCSTAYRFYTIDVGDSLHIRGKNLSPTLVYSLAPLPPGSFERFAELLEALPKKRPPGWFDRVIQTNRLVPHDWPVWVVDWNLPEKQRVTLDNNLMRILDEAEPPRLVFASNDPPKEIFAAKEVSAEDLAQVKDWFAYLGLNRAPRE